MSPARHPPSRFAERDGKLLYTLASGQVDTLTAGRPDTCFAGMLLIGRYDGSVWGLPTAERSQPTPLATGGRAGVVSYGALDRDGYLASARYADVTLLACPGFVPPKAPVDVTPPAIIAALPAKAGDPPTKVEIAAPAANAPSPGNPPPPPSTPPAAPPSPPPPAPAPLAPPSAVGGVQASSAPSAAGADAPDEERVTSIAASRDNTLTLALGAAVAAMALAYAVGTTSDPEPARRTTHRSYS